MDRLTQRFDISHLLKPSVLKYSRTSATPTQSAFHRMSDRPAPFTARPQILAQAAAVPVLSSTAIRGTSGEVALRLLRRSIGEMPAGAKAFACLTIHKQANMRTWAHQNDQVCAPHATCTVCRARTSSTMQSPASKQAPRTQIPPHAARTCNAEPVHPRRRPVRAENSASTKRQHARAADLRGEPDDSKGDERAAHSCGVASCNKKYEALFARSPES